MGSEHSRKEPSRQLIRWLFGTATHDEAGVTPDLYITVALPPFLCPQINIIADADPQTDIFATNSFLVIFRIKIFLDFLYELHLLWIFSMSYIIFGFSLSPLYPLPVTNCPCLGDRRFRIPDMVVST